MIKNTSSNQYYLKEGKIGFLLLCLFILLGISHPGKSIAIIPQPQEVKMGVGAFKLSAKTKIYIPKEYADDLKPYLTSKLKTDLGMDLQVYSGRKTGSNHYILFEKSVDISLPSEAYQLRVDPDKIVIKAGDYAGMFNAFQSLRQLIPVGASGEINIPVLAINDQPRFAWRGMMLDVSRHFRSKEFILKQIDQFSAYKINKFHWHLTDDQGWRIEIKKYPKLTQKGAWRADREGISWWQRSPAMAEEPKPVGGFYTQEEVKEIIEYARIRNVEVIPEIDVPAHSKALIASYPELFCFEKSNFEVAVGGKAPDNALCAGRENTYQFLEHVISEVAALFPSPYLHIGGDECDKRNWLKCPHCQITVKDQQLQNVEELQSYFIQRMNAIVVSKGKKMIGWDEILSGKGAKGATIMAWRRGMHSPEIDAPRSGYPTIMTSFQHSYISQVQGPNELEAEGPKGIVTLSKLYNHEPIPQELTKAEADLVLGTQACLWAEFTPTPEHTEYMLYPRALANAEVAWSNPAVKNWSRFQSTVEDHFARLKRDDINFSRSLYSIYGSYALDKLNQKAMLYLLTEAEGYTIYYTVDGTIPTSNAMRYDGVVALKPGMTVRAGLFDKDGNLLSSKLTELKLK
ncbi:beta-N-acetylhexosaminidase [Dyadobacter tibetensis]|uniref:beta-N-acetylhexosaminidase n=1 Tax=Dyadobacter tibetensis TaxID=1211851 RepID=UPI000472DDB5|nr:family 20 glycosylhydrolase [Dyadobacter tibetensis]